MEKYTTKTCSNVPTFQQPIYNNNQITINQLIKAACILLERWFSVGTRWNRLEHTQKFCWNKFYVPQYVGTLYKFIMLLNSNILTSKNTPLLERWNVGQGNDTHSNQNFF